MILYHGTNIDFDRIDIGKTKKYKDFGQGFYLTDIKTQAEELAEKRTLMLGGTPVVQEYEFDETILSTSDINVLIFDRVCADWAKFIYKNRSRTNPPFTHDYDIVIGPIADDGVAYLLGRYEEDSFTIEELAEKLRFKHLNNQYFFGTSKAISLLKGVFYKFHAF